MHRPTTPSGWLLGAGTQFDALTDSAEQVIARLVAQGAADEIVEIRRRVREVDGRDEASVTALATELRQRAAELAP